MEKMELVITKLEKGIEDGTYCLTVDYDGEKVELVSDTDGIVLFMTCTSVFDREIAKLWTYSNHQIAEYFARYGSDKEVSKFLNI